MTHLIHGQEVDSSFWQSQAELTVKVGKESLRLSFRFLMSFFILTVQEIVQNYSYRSEGTKPSSIKYNKAMNAIVYLYLE